MSDYDTLRHFADSWGLVMMGVLFLVFIGWTFRPGQQARLDAAAHSILEPDPAETPHAE
jgi:cytochrome c oxidase cbb3-type subunit 4